MIDRPKTDVIERVKKILARTTEAGCTTAEAETAFKLASRIMAEHALTMDEIEVGGGTEEDWIEEEGGDFGRMGMENTCASSICRDFFFVATYRHPHRNAAGHLRYRQMIFGKPAQVETAKWVYSSLLAAFKNLWDDHRKITGAKPSERRMFTLGLWVGLTNKLREEQTAAEAEHTATHGTGTSLAVISDKVQGAMRDAHSDLKPTKKQTKINGSAETYDAGVAAGRTINLLCQVGNGNQKGLACR